MKIPESCNSFSQIAVSPVRFQPVVQGE
jgi:hypothetical protein